MLLDQIEKVKMVKRVSEFLDQNFTEDERKELLVVPNTPTIREELDDFAKHIGAEHYAALTRGPGFSELFNRWIFNQASKKIDAIWDRIIEKIPEDEQDKVSRSDFEQFLFASVP